LESIAELLLFDSGINVYEDAYVYIPSDGGMFNSKTMAQRRKMT
jgi:hypothetical protein